MPFDERASIISNLKMVDEVISFDDDKYGSCAMGLKKVLKKYPNEQIIFANGGDRNKGNIHEMNVKGIDFAFSVGGDDKKILQVGFSKNIVILQSIAYGENFYNLFLMML